MTERTALLAGATGLVGREILAALLHDPEVRAVHVLARRDLPAQDPRVRVHRVDFAALPALPAVGEAYLALGTTIKVAGSQQAFRAVDHDANLAVARGVLAAGCRRAGVVSAMGADARSSIFYSRVKGELEDALAGLGFETLVIARPSMLTGDRAALGQPERAGEQLAMKLSRVLRPLIPANYRPVPAADVAGALVQEVPRARGRQVLLSGALHGAAR